MKQVPDPGLDRGDPDHVVLGRADERGQGSKRLQSALAPIHELVNPVEQQDRRGLTQIRRHRGVVGAAPFISSRSTDPLKQLLCAVERAVGVEPDDLALNPSAGDGGADHARSPASALPNEEQGRAVRSMEVLSYALNLGRD